MSVDHPPANAPHSLLEVNRQRVDSRLLGAAPLNSTEIAMFRLMRTLPLALALSQLMGLVAPAADDEAERTIQGLELFQAYLKKEHPDKKWQKGPSRLEFPAIRMAYGDLRLYVVYSSPPLAPGGARVSKAQEVYRREVEDIRTNYISVLARIDEKGQVIPLQSAQDYNSGLMKITGDDNARTAAAAILSLQRCNHVAPAAVDPGDVAVTRSDKGWSCQVNGKTFRGTVTFDADGKCTAVSKSYAGPLRP
jgi:hypothetical protein